MRYLGGKTRLKKELVPIIRNRVGRGIVWDAFCGGLAMSEGLAQTGGGLSSDACIPLIALYDGIRAGWQPPALVTKEMWEAAKALPDSDPLKGYAGFGCSFGGMYFSSYAKPEDTLTIASGPSAGHSCKRNYHAATIKVLKRQLAKIGTPFVRDFLLETPIPGFAAVYCDPPYADTVRYAGVRPFNHDLFYSCVEAWACVCPVFVSEYECPIGELVFERPAPKGCTMAKKNAVERMFLVSRPA
jgi:DNA adenine methylase